MQGKIKPVKLDLDKLTQEQFDRAMANPGSCTYSSPCIIGAMMPNELVERLKDGIMIGNGVRDFTNIRELVRLKVVSFPQDQLTRAFSVQKIFDSLKKSDSHSNNSWRLKELASELPHIKVPESI